MTVRKAIAERNGLYFITITCARWLPLFQFTNGYDIVYTWFDYLKKNGHFIIGYVIMPNHFHCLIAFKKSPKNLNTVIGNGKRFMAYELVKRLQEKKEEFTLSQLASFVNNTDRKRGKKHEVFEPSFDAKECYNDNFIEQKLNYMHENPCRGKWLLAETADGYPHSSACFYLTGLQGSYPIKNYMELKDIDLTL